MPTYQYQCTECGEGLEAVQKFTDDALTECPNCNGRLKKVFSAVGIVFKGSGFYRNDSRGSSSSSSPAVEAVHGHVLVGLEVLVVDVRVVVLGLEVVGHRLGRQLRRLRPPRSAEAPAPAPRGLTRLVRTGPRRRRTTGSSAFSRPG